MIFLDDLFRSCHDETMTQENTLKQSSVERFRLRFPVSGSLDEALVRFTPPEVRRSLPPRLGLVSLFAIDVLHSDGVNDMSESYNRKQALLKRVNDISNGTARYPLRPAFNYEIDPEGRLRAVDFRVRLGVQTISHLFNPLLKAEANEVPLDKTNTSTNYSFPVTSSQIMRESMESGDVIFRFPLPVALAKEVAEHPIEHLVNLTSSERLSLIGLDLVNSLKRPYRVFESLPTRSEDLLNGNEWVTPQKTVV